MEITNTFVNVSFAPTLSAEVRLQRAEIGYNLVLNHKTQRADYIAYMRANHKALEELVHMTVNIVEVE